MTIREMRQLNPGDRVQIVSEWGPGCKENDSGRMDHWLGQIMTVKGVHGDCVSMEEDQGEFCGHGWSWYPAAIECVIDDTTDDCEITDEEFFTILNAC